MKCMKLLATSLLVLSLGPVGVVLATHPDALEVQTQNGIEYVAGGIGKEQAEAMKVAAHDYDLMLTFATDGGKYLADTDLQIEDMNDNTLLNTVSKEPLFLANLPGVDIGSPPVRKGQAIPALSILAANVPRRSSSSGPGVRDGLRIAIRLMPGREARALHPGSILNP